MLKGYVLELQRAGIAITDVRAARQMSEIPAGSNDSREAAEKMSAIDKDKFLKK